VNWIELNEEAQLEQIKEKSKAVPQLIFKHSTRCSISTMAKARLERGAAPENVDFYYLDLIKYRNISNLVANVFNIEHESPQVLLIRDENCVYNESHSGISMLDIEEQAA